MKSLISYFNSSLEFKSENIPCFVIAEIAQAHEGSLGLAHSFIDAVATTGANAIKFQTHIAAAESTKDENFRLNIFPQDKTRFAYWKRMEFTFEEWAELAKHAKEKNLIFMSSPFSIEAFNLLNKIGVEGWKIGSGEVFTEELLKIILSTKKPLLMSTGMSNQKEVEKLVKLIKNEGSYYALMQCTSKYPTDLTEVGLNVMHEFKKKYKCPIGLSDHSGTVFPGLAAMAQGANFLELHVTFDKKMFGPDTSSSILIDELKLICQARDAFNILANNPINKNEFSEKLKDTKNLFTKSLSLINNQKKNTIIEEDMLTLKKPGTGIKFSEKKYVLGKKLLRDKSSNEILQWRDLK